MTKASSPLEGGAFTSRHVRILKISIAVMTALLILGILALVYGMTRQASKLGAAPKPAVASPAQSPYALSLDLGKGKLESVSASGDQLILYWKGEDSDTVLTIDPRNGRELGRIQVPHR
ncbi:MAG: hypothetical protein ACLPPF_16450 [Rhodomicrobium sp.]